MPKYAHYDHTIIIAQRVRGWYDTDMFDYAAVPPKEDFLLLNETEWKTRLYTPFIENGKLIPEPPPSENEKEDQNKKDALVALRKAFTELVIQPITYMENSFAADATAIAEITQFLALDKFPADFVWENVDGKLIPMTQEEFQGLLQAINDRWMAAKKAVFTPKIEDEEGKVK